MLAYEKNRLSMCLMSAFQVVNVTSNGNEQSIADHEAVIKQLKDENSLLKER